MDLISLLAIASLTFLFAGTAKGVVGLGLPAIAIAALSNFMTLPIAIQLVLAPAIATNFWQALDGGYLKPLLKRLWLFLLLVFLAAWLAYRFVLLSFPTEMTLLLGALLCVYAVVGFGYTLPKLSARSEKWSGPLFGIATGFFAGTTGTTSLPSVAYLESLGLNRNELVQAMGLTFGLPMVAIGFSVASVSSVELSTLWVSLFSVIPAFFGMWLGRKIRHRISEKLFKNLLYSGLLLVGLRLLWVHL